MKTKAVHLFALAALVAGTGMAVAQSDDQSEKEAADIVASQVRDQGYSCDDPVSAKADKDEDGDDVWRLDCANAAYRVRLVPDMAASIEVID